jgi:hypothetical protein
MSLEIPYQSFQETSIEMQMSIKCLSTTKDEHQNKSHGK